MRGGGDSWQGLVTAVGERTADQNKKYAIILCVRTVLFFQDTNRQLPPFFRDWSMTRARSSQLWSEKTDKKLGRFFV